MFASQFLRLLLSRIIAGVFIVGLAFGLRSLSRASFLIDLLSFPKRKAPDYQWKRRSVDECVLISGVILGADN